MFTPTFIGFFFKIFINGCYPADGGTKIEESELS
jgi:hypothetical protein